MPTKACKQKPCLGLLSILYILMQILPRARSNTILDFKFTAQHMVFMHAQQ